MAKCFCLFIYISAEFQKVFKGMLNKSVFRGVHRINLSASTNSLRQCVHSVTLQIVIVGQFGPLTALKELLYTGIANPPDIADIFLLRYLSPSCHWSCDNSMYRLSKFIRTDNRPYKSKFLIKDLAVFGVVHFKMLIHRR